MAKNRSKEKAASKNTSIWKNQKIFLFLGLALILTGTFGILVDKDKEWSLTDEGLLSYPERDDIEYSVIETDVSNSNYTVKTIEYMSRSRTVPSLLTIPERSSDKTIPAVVILPGAGVPKENEHDLSVILAEMGYASIIIDQRNLGSIDLESDLELFNTGLEPVQYLMVYDALKASDVLTDQTEIDSSKIAMLGSSNGGRSAIIASALDDSISGVVAISTSGYDSDSIDHTQVTDQKAYTLYRSVDPDNYLADISPRTFVMMHSTNDSIIAYDLAQNTFGKAAEPKQFITVDGTSHGFTGAMKPYLEEELEKMFE